MDWKEVLSSHLSGKGIYRLDYLNSQLHKWLTEWTKYLDQFSSMRTELAIRRPEDDESFIQWHCVTVRDTLDFYFRAYLIYSVDDAANQICLKIKSNQAFNMEEGIKASRDSERKYYWADQEVFTEPEIFEEGYVLQLLNDRFINFTNKTQLFG